MKSLVKFLGVVLFVSAAACSSSSNAASSASSGSCPAVGSTVCSADPAITQDDVNQCNTAINDPNCGAQYKAELECAGSNVKCDSSNHEDDSAIATSCANQISAYSACASAHAGDGGT
jgi:hypothetical protein